MNKLRELLFVLLIICLNPQSSAQSPEYNLSGFVKDAVTGEVIIAANILLYRDSITSGGALRVTSTNNYGFYVFPKLPRGNYYLIARYIGYKTAFRELRELKESSIHFNFDLTPSEIMMGEIVITGKKPDKSLISNIDVSPELLSRLPSLSGETDIFKMIQMLPGVKTSNELSSGLYVRGGSPDQNLTLVDGVVQYNPSHIGNIASTFNSNAVQEIRLIKGAFPAEYGGRLSSVLDIKQKSGTMERNKGALGIGLINSFLALEGPLGKKSTYMVSGRVMYYDAYQKSFNKNSIIPRYNFYDLNSKINFGISDADIFSTSIIYSKDNLYSPPSISDLNYNTGWDNLSIGINLLHVNSRSLLISSSLSYIDYGFRTLITNNSQESTAGNFFSSSRLKDFTIKENVEVHLHEEHILKTGAELTGHKYNLLYSTAYNPLLEIDPFAGNDLFSIEAALYFQTESQLTSQLKLNAGARLYYFGERKYFNAEPRVELAYSLTENTVLKSAYALTHQFLHLIVRNDISLPTDLWYPSTENILPGSSAQYIIGIDHYFEGQDYLVSVESYYRNMDNLYEYKTSAQLNSAFSSVENELIKGRGEAYGIELFFNKKAGNITGWAGYTLSWTRRQFDELNNGKVFYPKYDRRNDLSFVIAWMINERWSTGLTWTYASGERFSQSSGQYIFREISPGSRTNMYVDYPELNNEQLPAFHKLDFNLTYKFLLAKPDIEAYVNIYNLYNRQNPFAQYISTETDSKGNKSIKAKQLILFPFIPTFGFNIKF